MPTFEEEFAKDVERAKEAFVEQFLEFLLQPESLDELERLAEEADDAE